MSVTRFFMTLALLAAASTVSACSMFRQRSSSHIVEGDSPTIKYTERESAGGRLGGQ